jgi:uncharacterized Zn finger protein
MKDVQIHQIQQSFSEITFARGMGYFENEYVEMGVRMGNKLVGTVRGAAPSPYKVTVEILDDEIHSKCTCPVGRMCKHGVALILQWINNKNLFLDAHEIMASLEEKSKNELLNIIKTMLDEDPFLISKLVSSIEIKENKVNIEAISRRIDYSTDYHSTHEFIDYYSVSGMSHELYRVKSIADTLKTDGNFKEALEVYFLLIEKGAEIYGNTDDSSGELGDLIIECVEDFTDGVKVVDDDEKLTFIPRIIKVVEEEDYGLDTENMLFAVATKNNMHLIEEEMLKRIPEGTDHHCGYQRKKLIDLLYYLYEGLDLHADALKVTVKLGFKNKNDYLRIAEALMKDDRDGEAFAYVKEGVRLEEKGSHQLDELFFSFLNQLPIDKWADVKEDEVMEIALGLLNSRYNTKAYPPIKSVFIKMGRYDELIKAIKTKCRVDAAIPLLLHDGHVDDAIELAVSPDSLNTALIIKVATVARDNGKTKDAMKLTFKALKQNWQINIDENFIGLIELLVENSEDEELEKAINQVRNISTAKILATALLRRNQEYALRLLLRLLKNLEEEEIKNYSKQLRAEYAIKLCKAWISQTVNHSHVYYENAIGVLRLLRKIMNDAEFRMYIHDFAARNKGKKKLLSKMKEVDLM